MTITNELNIMYHTIINKLYNAIDYSQFIGNMYKHFNLLTKIINIFTWYCYVSNLL